MICLQGFASQSESVIYKILNLLSLSESNKSVHLYKHIGNYFAI